LGLHQFQEERENAVGWAGREPGEAVKPSMLGKILGGKLGEKDAE